MLFSDQVAHQHSFSPPAVSTTTDGCLHIAINKGRRSSLAQLPLAVAGQGQDVNILDGTAMSGMISIHAATTLSLPKMDPVRGTIRGSSKTGRIDQGFQEQWPVAEKLLPIVRQPACGQRQYLTGK